MTLSQSALSHFANYGVGDTLYFTSNLGDTDTLCIMTFEDELYDKLGGLIQRMPSHTRSLTIQHLPRDRFKGFSWSSEEDSEKDVRYQNLLSITKFPTKGETELSVSFKNFHSRSDKILGERLEDGFIVNGNRTSNCYRIEHYYPERLTQNDDIATVYWCDSYGLTSYVSVSGEVWTYDFESAKD